MSTTFPETIRPSTIEPQQAAHRSLADMLVLIPILLATAFSICITTYSMAYRFTRPFALTPWESEMIVDAWRANHGLKVYEDPAKFGHATHMYGPLVTYTIAAISKFTGPNFYVGRAINLFAGLAFCALIVWAFARRRPLEIFVAAGLALALHYRCRAFFTEARPDVMGLMLASIAVLLLYRAEEGGRTMLYVPATALILLAMFYKQTYCAAAGVPVVAVLLRRPPQMLKRLALSLIPLIAVIAALALMRFAAPILYFYMVKIGTMYSISKSRLIVGAYGLLTLCPFFYALAIAFSVDRRRTERDAPKFVWLAAAVLVGTVACILPFAKRGGSYNSMLLAFAPMTAFCMAALGWLFDKLTDPNNDPLPRWLASTVAGATIVATTLCVPKADLWGFTGAHGDKTYADAVRAARKLKGTVICFDDPTIPLRANGYVGRCLDAELDASGRLGDNEEWYQLPKGLADEIASADWVIRVHANFDSLGPKFNDKYLSRWGFKRVKFLKEKSVYTLWQRERPATLPANVAPGRPVESAD